MSRGDARRVRHLTLVEHSPLRGVDPRTKLALALCTSLAVMLPLERLVVALVLYAGLLAWARLLPVALRQVWRLRWLLLVLFIVDWLVISPELATVITLRIVLLAGTFALFFSTTTPGELRLALEWMRLPYRYAFSVSLAFQSVDLLDEEWRTIREAQRARGAWQLKEGWRDLRGQVRDMVALTVPAMVMTAKRAWSMTEAAYARGFDSPRRRPYRRLSMGRLDWLLLALTLVSGLVLVFWH
jgi:energy-coupling factor transport system permease protein